MDKDGGVDGGVGTWGGGGGGVFERGYICRAFCLKQPNLLILWLKNTVTPFKEIAVFA